MIPQIRLNLVLLKGIEILGFEFRGFASHAAAARQRNDAELMQLFASGRVTPYIGARFPFDKAAAALQFVADGRAIGKVVLDVAPR